jgi:hypothetical protein
MFFQISFLLCNISNVNQQNEMSIEGNFSLDFAWLLELKKDVIMATESHLIFHNHFNLIDLAHDDFHA